MADTTNTDAAERVAETVPSGFINVFNGDDQSPTRVNVAHITRYGWVDGDCVIFNLDHDSDLTELRHTPEELDAKIAAALSPKGESGGVAVSVEGVTEAEVIDLRLTYNYLRDRFGEEGSGTQQAIVRSIKTVLDKLEASLG